MRTENGQDDEVKLREALARVNLTEVEWAVMCRLVADDSATPDSLAQSCLLYQPEVDIAPYLAAVDTLLKQGYALVLDAEHVAAMWAEIAREDIHTLTGIVYSNCYSPGNVDLTSEGYFVFREIVPKVFGPMHLEFNESGIVDDDEGTLRVYGESANWGVYARVGEAAWALAREGKRIRTVHPPVPIGEWRPNRFLTHPSGVCVCIEYEGGNNEI